MPTEFQDVYNFFLSKIETYEYENFTDEELNILFQQMLRIAFKQCKYFKDIKVDWNMETFNRVLTDEEIDIVASYMLVEWYNPRINTDLAIKQTLSSKDYKLTSQANHIATVKDLRQNALKEARYLAKQYELTKFKESRK